ncbi:hypothetical protein M0R04_06535 [Candidatus Dojkabacteria bacterium]|jgi:hypothetical protein|nr:hypothetical protein [Candidatus Dojkabacteria bacterium]
MSRKTLSVELFPDIEAEITIDKKKDSAIIVLHSQRNKKTKSILNLTVSQAFSVFHNLHKIRKEFAEKQRNKK